jgi:FtsP/CotA-like multicopper oxidase with cupredoxin domain
MIIYGPASANYDEDLGTYPITDWYTRNVYQLGIASESGAPPTANTALINGTMKVGTVGTYAKTNITATKKYRLRIINTSVDNGFQVSLDNHDFEVIAADFVPIKPYNTTWLFVGIGQRYDVVIRANQSPGNYWFRATVPSGLCGSNTLSTAGNIKSIFSYSTAKNGSEPTTTPKVAAPATCADEVGLIPKLAKPVPKSQFVFHDNNGENKLTLALGSRPSTNRPGLTVNSWRVNG